MSPGEEILIGIVTLFAVSGICLAGLFAAALADERRGERRRAAAERVRGAGVIPDGQYRRDLLALSCGPCAGVPFATRCICAGNCGSQRCRGAHVDWDQAGELERITKGDRRG
jgi:hypothetical protein